ncbi:MAG: ECF transporter S component [Clostridia bacterium]|nr:ECF transporter S component [Clostridia bacterium]
MGEKEKNGIVPDTEDEEKNIWDNRYDANAEEEQSTPDDGGPDAPKETKRRGGRGILSRRGDTASVVRKVVAMAIFTALAYACEFILHINVGFLTFDMKDAVITIAGLFYGPLAALIMSAVVSLLEFATISGTGLWGLLMNFVSTAAFACIASLIYRRRRTIGAAIAGLGGSVAGMTAVMIGMNLLITPIYLGTELEKVIESIPLLLLPFNIAKAVLNASLTLLFYKPVVTALRAAHFIQDGQREIKFTRKSVFVLVLGGALLVASVLFFILYLNGTFVLVDK